jgi:hypothetical protein
VVSRVHTEKESRFHNMSRFKHTVSRIPEDVGSGSMSSSIGNNLPEEVKFDCITYDYNATNQKILYELLMLKPNEKKDTKAFKIELPGVEEEQFTKM